MKPAFLAIKVKDLLLEVAGNNIDPNKIKVEHKWLGLLQVDKIQPSSGRLVINPFWQVRRSEKEFSNWWKMKNKFSIFFDGLIFSILKKKSRECWSKWIDLLSGRKASN